MTGYLLSIFGLSISLVVISIIVVPLCFVGSNINVGDKAQKIIAAVSLLAFMAGDILLALALFAFLIGVWARIQPTSD